jgi:hypothetical protein
LELITAAQRLNNRNEQDLETAMGLFFYVVMFVAACGFGWWTRGGKSGN